MSGLYACISSWRVLLPGFYFHWFLNDSHWPESLASKTLGGLLLPLLVHWTSLSSSLIPTKASKMVFFPAFIFELHLSFPPPGTPASLGLFLPCQLPCRQRCQHSHGSTPTDAHTVSSVSSPLPSRTFTGGRKLEKDQDPSAFGPPACIT